MRYFGILIAMSLMASCAARQGGENEKLSREVNPMIGTDFTGNTYPGAQAPHGMVQLSPDNGLPGWDRIAGYFYPDSTIAGFSHTHLSGTGAGDLYDISFMPAVEPLSIAEAPLGLHSKFSHEREAAWAGYYRVHLDDYNIDVELTATPRCGIQRYTFNTKPDSAMVVLNLSKATNWDRTLAWHVEQRDSVTLVGYRFSDGWARNQNLYFCSRFSQPIRALEQDTVVTMRFDLSNAKGALTLSTALSAVSEEGAVRNLQAEAPADDFDSALAATEEAWNRALSKVRIKSDDKDLRTTFYTALYHSMLAPTLYCDVDGAYRGPDSLIHEAKGWENYSTFSLWDTYRAAHPLYTIVEPERAADMARSIIAFAEQNGRLPVWNMHASETDMMIGYHAAAVLAEASLKGLLSKEEQELALKMCVATANLDDYRQIGLYKQLGYVPADAECEGENWTLSKTLEYAYDDHCIAELARHLGDEETAATFEARAMNYQNVWNPATGFMQPRLKSGAFVEPFKAEDYTEYICESNAWHYLWSVQHDIPGLVTLMGGAEAFEARLDSLFSYKPAEGEELPIFSTGMIGQYVHGNEPCHHVAYLYNYVGKPQKAQHYVAEIVHGQYSNTPAGLCGNEDCGQTSAWLVWSALGMYPVDPVSLTYELGTPLFEEATVDLPGGKQLLVKATGVSKERYKVREVKLNGARLPEPRLSHEQLMQGGLLEFEME
ncbi:MAG: GH92 family glycosyl hydrolase [Muribaculaceae bacterium]